MTQTPKNDRSRWPADDKVRGGVSMVGACADEIGLDAARCMVVILAEHTRQSDRNKASVHLRAEDFMRVGVPRTNVSRTIKALRDSGFIKYGDLNGTTRCRPFLINQKWRSFGLTPSKYTLNT